MKNQTANTNETKTNVKVAEETKTVETKKCKIFVGIGPSGMVNNTTMIPVLKAHINNLDGLKELLQFYPTVVKASTKYLSNKEKAILKPIIQAVYPDFDVEIKETVAKASKVQTEEHQMLLTILHNIDNLVGITRLKVEFPELFEKAIDYGIDKLHSIKEKKN